MVLKQFGDSLKDVESMAIKSGKELMERLEVEGKEALDPRRHVRSCIAKIILTLTYGDVAQTDIEEMEMLEEKWASFMSPAGDNLLLDIFPSLVPIFPSMHKTYMDLVKVSGKMNRLLRKLLTSRLTRPADLTPELYIDHFIKLDGKTGQSPESYRGIHIDNDDVHYMGMDLVIAGITTTSTSLITLLAILVNHPEIQDIAYENIISVLGNSTPTLKDKESIPYVMAMLLELWRYAAGGPFLIPHYSSKEAELGGYLIPKNTLIFPNIWNLHHDDRYWENPWVFDPLRFMENGSLLPPDSNERKRMLIFGSGSRRCPGENLAKNRLFILVTMLLQKYKFLPAKGFPKPKHDPREYDSYIALTPKPFHLCVQPRQ